MMYRSGALLFCIVAALAVVARAQVPTDSPIVLQPVDISPLLQQPNLDVPPGVTIPIDPVPVTVPVDAPVAVPVEAPAVPVPASINLVWRTNPECLGPASDYAQFVLQQDVEEEDVDAVTCSPFNSTYSGGLTYHISATDNTSTCNTTGVNYYNLYLDDECTGVATPLALNTSCNPFNSASVGGKKRAGCQLGDQEIPSSSQQFSCDVSTWEMAPYVQIIGPGCDQTGNLDFWTVTWSNEAGSCVKVYNVSSLATDYDYEFSYALVENVCEPGAVNYNVNMYNDSTCTGEIVGTMTFSSGCNAGAFNATCFTNTTNPNPNAPDAAPVAVLPPGDATPSNPSFNTPQFAPLVAPDGSIPAGGETPVDPSPSAASTTAASATLLVSAAAVLAYLL